VLGSLVKETRLFGVCVWPLEVNATHHLEAFRLSGEENLRTFQGEAVKILWYYEINGVRR